jgi:hypothetical protein
VEGEYNRSKENHAMEITRVTMRIKKKKQFQVVFHAWSIISNKIEGNNNTILQNHMKISIHETDASFQTQVLKGTDVSCIIKRKMYQCGFCHLVFSDYESMNTHEELHGQGNNDGTNLGR